LLRASFSATC
jgi:hypothetical protein